MALPALPMARPKREGAGPGGGRHTLSLPYESRCPVDLRLQSLPDVKDQGQGRSSTNLLRRGLGTVYDSSARHPPLGREKWLQKVPAQQPAAPSCSQSPAQFKFPSKTTNEQIKV